MSFSVALNTVDFVDYAGYFTYYDHQLDTISPQGGQLQGGSAVTIYGKRFRTLVDAVGASADSHLDRPPPLRRARAGGGDDRHDRVGDQVLLVELVSRTIGKPRVRSDRSRSTARTSCRRSTARTAASSTPTPARSSSTTRRPSRRLAARQPGSAPPTSASPASSRPATTASPRRRSACSRRRRARADAQTSVLKALEPLVVECEACRRAGGEQQHGGRPADGLSRSTATYVADDSADYVAIRNVCPANVVGNYQQFGQYRHAVPTVDPTGGPVGGGTTVTIRGEGFTPITTPSLDAPMLSASVRCLWSCTPRTPELGPVAARVLRPSCVAAAPLLTRPVSVPTMRSSATRRRAPPPASRRSRSRSTCTTPSARRATTAAQRRRGRRRAAAPPGACAPSRYDGVQNGEETGVDSRRRPRDRRRLHPLPVLHPRVRRAGRRRPGLPAPRALARRSRRRRRATRRCSRSTARDSGRRASSSRTRSRCSAATSSSRTTRRRAARSRRTATGTRRRRPSTTRRLSRAARRSATSSAATRCSSRSTSATSTPTCSRRARRRSRRGWRTRTCPPRSTWVPDAYAYEGDFIHSGLQFKFYDHPAPTFAGRALWGASRLVDVVPKAGFDAARAPSSTGAAVIKVEGGGPLLGGAEKVHDLARRPRQEQRRAAAPAPPPHPAPPRRRPR